MSQKRARPDSSDSESLAIPQIFRSSPIEDRSSKFIAFYSPSLSAKSLQAHAEFKSASHRIAAWRKRSNQTALPFPSRSALLYEIGSDEDGERWAGKRLEKVLRDLDVEGAVVVARWYGGILLGSDRFNHIEHCAREAILEGKGERNQDQCENRSRQKQRKLKDEDLERTTLVRNLPKRDQSISILRELLKDQLAISIKLEERFLDSHSGTPKKEADYSSMTLQSLKRLEKARDATIAWIIKEIDRAGKNTDPAATKEP